MDPVPSPVDADNKFVRRFLMESRSDIKAQQSEEDKALTEDLTNLSKKVGSALVMSVYNKLNSPS